MVRTLSHRDRNGRRTRCFLGHRHGIAGNGRCRNTSRAGRCGNRAVTSTCYCDINSRIVEQVIRRTIQAHRTCGLANGPTHVLGGRRTVRPLVVSSRGEDRRVATRIGGRSRTTNGQLRGVVTTPRRGLSAPGIGQCSALRRYRRYRGSANLPGHAHRVCSAIDPAVAVLRCKGRRIAAHIGGRRRTANGQLDGAITTPGRRLSAAGIGQATALYRIADNTFTRFAFAGAGIRTGNSGIGNCPHPRHSGQLSRRIAFSKSLDIPLTIRPGDVGRSLSRQIAIRTDELKVLAKRYSLELIAVGECVFHVRYRTGIEAAQIQSFQAIALVEHHLQALDLCGIEITQIQRSQGFTAMEHTIHLSCIRRVETTEAIDRRQGIAGIEHLPHVLCRRRIPTRQVQCCELLISTEDAVEIRHLRGVKAAQIQCLDLRQAVEHGLHDRDVGRVQLIQPGELRQRAKCIERAGGVRIRHDLPIPIAGNGQLRAVEVSHNTAVLRCGSIPGFSLTASCGVGINEQDLRDRRLRRRTLIPGILSSQSRNRSTLVLNPAIRQCRCVLSHDLRCPHSRIHIERAVSRTSSRERQHCTGIMQEGDLIQAGTVHRKVPSKHLQRCRNVQLRQSCTAGEHTGRALTVIRCPIFQITQGPAVDIHIGQILTIPEHAINAGDDALIPHTQVDLRQTGIDKHLGGILQLAHIPRAQINLSEIRTAFKHIVGLYEFTGIPTAAIYCDLGNAGIGKHLVHVGGISSFPPGHIQRCNRLTAGEHTDHLRHALGIPPGHIQDLQPRAVHEHAIVTARSTGILDLPGVPGGDIHRLQHSVLREHTPRIDHHLRIHDIRAIDLLQGGHTVIRLGKRPHGIRVCIDLSVSVTGDRQGLLICTQVYGDLTLIFHAVHSLVCRSIPGCFPGCRRVLIHDIDGLQQIVVDRRSRIAACICPVILPGVLLSQHRERRHLPLRRNNNIRLSDLIVHHRHDPCLGVLIQCHRFCCAALAVLHRCAIIGIGIFRGVGEGDCLPVDRHHRLSTVIGSLRCTRQGTAFHGLDLHHVTAVIIGPVIIQNLGVACYDLGAKRVHRRVLNVTGFALALVVIGDIKRLAAKLDIRPRRMAKGNRRQLRAVSCEIRPYHHQALRQRQLRKALTVREHSIGLRYLGHIPPGDVNAPQRVTAAEHDAGILQARGIPVGHVDRLKALAVLEHVMGILEAGHIPVLNTLYFCQASALHEHIVGFFQFGSIPAGGVHGSKGMVRPAIVHEHTGRFFQRRRIPCGIRSGTILSRTGIGPQINARERVTAIEHVAHVRYFAHIPRRDTDICQRLIEIEHIRHRSGIPCIQQIRVGDALERRQIAERPGRILIGKDKAIAVPGNDKALLIRAQERRNSPGHGRIRGIPGRLPCARHMVVREGDGLQRILIQLRCRTGTEPCILCV